MQKRMSRLKESTTWTALFEGGWEFHSKTTRRLRSGESWWCTRCCKFQVMLLFGRPFEIDCVYLINTVGSWSVFSINKYSQENKKNRFLPFCKNTSEFSHFLPRSLPWEEHPVVLCCVGWSSCFVLFVYFPSTRIQQQQNLPFGWGKLRAYFPYRLFFGWMDGVKEPPPPRITLHSLCLANVHPPGRMRITYKLHIAIIIWVSSALDSLFGRPSPPLSNVPGGVVRLPGN